MTLPSKGQVNLSNDEWQEMDALRKVISQRQQNMKKQQECKNKLGKNEKEKILSLESVASPLHSPDHNQRVKS